MPTSTQGQLRIRRRFPKKRCVLPGRCGHRPLRKVGGFPRSFRADKKIPRRVGRGQGCGIDGACRPGYEVRSHWISCTLSIARGREKVRRNGARRENFQLPTCPVRGRKAAPVCKGRAPQPAPARPPQTGRARVRRFFAAAVWKHSARLSRRPPPRASDCRPEARIPPAAAARQIRPLPRLLFLILHEGARERARTGEARLFFCGNRRVSLQKRPSLAKIIPYMKRRRCI